MKTTSKIGGCEVETIKAKEGELLGGTCAKYSTKEIGRWLRLNELLYDKNDPWGVCLHYYQSRLNDPADGINVVAKRRESK